MTKQEADFIGSMNMCDEISNEAYKKIMCNCEVEEQQPCDNCVSKQEVNKLVDELARAISDERCFMSRGRSTTSIMQDIIDLQPVTPQHTELEEAEKKQEEKKVESIEDKTWLNFISVLSMRSYYEKTLEDITKEPTPPCFNSICDPKYLKFALDGLEDAMAALTMLYKNILERSGTHGE